jgi:endonuclease G
MKPFFRYFFFFFIVFLLTVFVILLQKCISIKHSEQKKGHAYTEQINDSLWKQHVYLGLPLDDDPRDDILLKRPQFVVSYNPKKNVANWVAWQLNDTWYGDTPRRKGKFLEDPLLPSKYSIVSHDDYTNCGYDRGHIVRSKERTRNKEDNTSTFFLTNIYPQTPDLNRGPWLQLEKYCEKLSLDHNKDLYIYAGGIFVSNHTLCNQNKIVIPDSCYKIVCILKKNSNIKDISATTSIIAVAMPNTHGIRTQNWKKYITTVTHIENSTGYDFFSNIAPEIQKHIEQQRYSN